MNRPNRKMYYMLELEQRNNDYRVYKFDEHTYASHLERYCDYLELVNDLNKKRIANLKNKIESLNIPFKEENDSLNSVSINTYKKLLEENDKTNIALDKACELLAKGYECYCECPLEDKCSATNAKVCTKEGWKEWLMQDE